MILPTADVKASTDGPLATFLLGSHPIALMIGLSKPQLGSIFALLL